MKQNNNNTKHLYILFHGLWGNHKHMHAIRDYLLEYNETTQRDSSAHEIVVFIPCKSGYFKTFDGIDIVGDRTFIEIMEFLKENDYAFQYISCIGYSMGGLVARYCMGKLYAANVFSRMKPKSFITFATPHIGVEFFNKQNYFYNLLRLLGCTFLGRSGRQLFIKDSYRKLLVELVTKDIFVKGLEVFENKLVFCNVENDRVVSFYTSFITNKCEKCDYSVRENDFEHIIPRETFIVDVTVPPKTNLIASANSDYNVLNIVKLVSKFSILTLLGVLLSPFILLLNLGGTLYSYYSVSVFKLAAKNFENYQLISDDDISSDWEEVRSVAYPKDTTTGESKEWSSFILKYSQNDDNFNQPNSKPLDLDQDRSIIYKNLSNIKWIRIPYYLKTFNSHRTIVARDGIEHVNDQGRKTLKFSIKLIIFLQNNTNIDNKIQ
ncbi:putative hydrolase SCDLUD_003153 [Saccharomycodes ludwigii]|uniref:putative hydrolase n=1 Tax=Saccharomycodes ludwigii TaxID=36035 RepID=UPI001E873812|nr:hypothetical protein SCDLUD_003153 [Saccharomycodes ludwigii]KAH3900182.1 hypothetical protein SCDLUD_003153 [Saccharomycodes ludwigii]